MKPCPKASDVKPLYIDPVPSATDKKRIWSWRHAVAESDMKANSKSICHAISLDVSETGRYTNMEVGEIVRLSSLSKRTVETHLGLIKEAGFLKIKVLRDAQTGAPVGRSWTPCFPANTDMATEATLNAGAAIRVSDEEGDQNANPAALNANPAGLNAAPAFTYKDDLPSTFPETFPKGGEETPLPQQQANKPEKGRPEPKQPEAVDPSFHAPSEAKPKKKAQGRPARIAADWQPSEANHAWAKKWGVPAYALELAADAFHTYWTECRTKGALKLDWSAAFRIWMAKDLNRLRALKPPVTTTGPAGGEVSGEERTLAREWAEYLKDRVWQPFYAIARRFGGPDGVPQRIRELGERLSQDQAVPA